MALRRNFAWAATAAASQALYGWAILGILAKLQDPAAVGMYALGTAIIVPILALTGLQLRDAFITDTARRFVIGNYLGLRALTLAISIAGIMLVGYLTQFKDTAFLYGLAMLRSSESFGEMMHAVLQQKEELRMVAILSVCRHLLTIVAFGLGLVLFHRPDIAIWSAAIVSAVFIATVDARISAVYTILRRERSPTEKTTVRPLIDLAIASIPLGSVLVTSALALSTPRYFLAAFTSPFELGVFAALHSTISAFYVLQTTIGSVTMPRLASSYNRGDYRSFGKLGSTVVFLGAALGCAIYFVCSIFGRQILSLLFTREYALYTTLFSQMALVSLVTCAYGAYAFLLVSMSCFRTNAVISTINLGLTALFCTLSIGSLGILGAVLAIGCSNFISLLLSVRIYNKELEKLKESCNQTQN